MHANNQTAKETVTDKKVKKAVIPKYSPTHPAQESKIET